MANNKMTSVVEEIIADGRLRLTPYNTLSAPVVHDIDLDLLSTRLHYILKRVYTFWDPLNDQYTGTMSDVTATISNDIDSLVDFAMWCCYNRLRKVAMLYAPKVFTSRMNPEAPCPTTRMEFPDFVSSVIRSIGPLRITDSGTQFCLIYATAASKMKTYGRAAVQWPNWMSYDRLMKGLRSCGVKCSAVNDAMDPANSHGSFWTTCRLTLNEGLYNFFGTVHPCHYTNIADDVVLATILSEDPTLTPFPNVVNSGGRSGNQQQPVYTCYLAHRICSYHIDGIWREKLTVAADHHDEKT